jgi:hypothetical protein
MFPTHFNHSRASELQQQPLLTADVACDGRMSKTDAGPNEVEISADGPVAGVTAVNSDVVL